MTESGMARHCEGRSQDQVPGQKGRFRHDAGPGEQIQGRRRTYRVEEKRMDTGIKTDAKSSRLRIKDWVGRIFGDLTVVSYDGRRGGKHYWRCRCRCGEETVVSQSNLQDGHTRSCGCRANPAGTRHFVDGTCIESIRSRKVSVRNRSGIRGVYRNRRTGRWVAQITFQGRTSYLGSFEELEEAAAARAEAEKTFERFLEKYADKGAGE